MVCSLIGNIFHVAKSVVNDVFEVLTPSSSE